MLGKAAKTRRGKISAGPAALLALIFFISFRGRPTHLTMATNKSNKAVSMAAPSLNVYKKMAIIRNPTDSLNYEDSDGNIKSVSAEQLGDAISTAVSCIALLTCCRRLFACEFYFLRRFLLAFHCVFR